MDIFSKLDPHYGLIEKYLRVKVAVAKIFGRKRELGRFISALLHLNPSLQEELLPLYVTALQRIELANFEIPNYRAEVMNEIEELLQLFPSQFDLLRLSLIYADASNKDARLKSYATRISPVLYLVLVLQYYLDHGAKISICKKMIPDHSQFGQSKEADWRLLSALLTHSLDLKAKELQTYIDRIAPNHDLKHEFLSKIVWRNGPAVPLSILKKWREKGEKSWRPLYHMAYYYKEKGDLEEFIDTLMEATDSIETDCPEFTYVMKTCEFYEMQDARRPSLEDFDDDEFDENEDDADMLRKVLQQLFGGRR